MTLFFTSDQHFGHGGARGLFKRPFASTTEMDEALVAAWNDVVEPAGTVWHLGDFAVRPSPGRIEALLARLNGTKHLVAGNNDHEATREAKGWASVQDYAEIRCEERLIVLCHYPLRSWNRMQAGSLQLHGHSHGRLAPLTRQLDVGVDAQGPAPLHLAAVIERLTRRRRRIPVRQWA